MQWRQVEAQDGRRTLVLVLETGDEVMGTLQGFAREQQLAGSHFTALGAFSRATVAFFDWERREYEHIRINEQMEVLTLVGDVSLAEGAPRLHAHVVLGKRDGTAHGGHLIEAYVRPTLEIVLVELPRHLQRRHDPDSGLSLIRFE